MGAGTSLLSTSSGSTSINDDPLWPDQQLVDLSSESQLQAEAKNNHGSDTENNSTIVRSDHQENVTVEATNNRYLLCCSNKKNCYKLEGSVNCKTHDQLVQDTCSTASCMHMNEDTESSTSCTVHSAENGHEVEDLVLCACGSLVLPTRTIIGFHVGSGVHCNK